MQEKIEVNGMNDGKTNNKSLESIVVTIVMSIFIIFSIYYFPILLLVVPVAFIAFGVKNDLISSLLSLITTLLIVGIITEPMISLLYFLLFGPFTAVNIYLIRKRMKANKVVLYSAVIIFISVLILYGILSINGIDLISELRDEFSRLLSAQMEMFKDMGLTSYELLETRDSIKSDYEEFILKMPSVLLVLSLIGSYINYLLTTSGLRKIGISILNLPRFSRFSVPDNFAFGALIMVVSSFIITMMNITYSNSIYVNIMVLLSAVLFIQGMSVADYFFIKIKMKRFIRVLTYLIIIFTPYIFSMVSFIGGIDVIFDLRKIKKVKSI